MGCDIELKNIYVSYGNNNVLKNISLKINKGSFVAIVGHSGCGKSTLLKIIAGLEKNYKGEITINNSPSNSNNNNNIRVLFQEHRLLPWKKVIDNIRLGSITKDREKSRKSLKNVGLIDKLNEWPSVLSGGQKQRVALARALVSNPKLLLFDEPLGALDALTRIEMQQLIENVWIEQKFTALFVTHDITEAVTLADRVILLKDGVIDLDMDISLSHPRKAPTDISYFSEKILGKIMNREVNPQVEFTL